MAWAVTLSFESKCIVNEDEIIKHPCTNSDWNHSSGGTTSLSFNIFLISAIGVFFGIPYFHMQAAFINTRIDVVLLFDTNQMGTHSCSQQT